MHVIMCVTVCDCKWTCVAILDFSCNAVIVIDTEQKSNSNNIAMQMRINGEKTNLSHQMMHCVAFVFAAVIVVVVASQYGYTVNLLHCTSQKTTT